MDDEETIRRVLDGQTDCFAVLVEKYQKKIVGTIYHMTRDHHLSEDLGQDVFLEVYRNLPSFDPARGSFSTWLYRIAQNKSLNAIKRKKPVFLSEIPEPAGARSAFHEVASEELHAEFDRILDRLPVKQKIAFVWAEIEQLSYQDIAEIEGVSIGTVKSRINSARKQLRKAFEIRKGITYE
jgi:RNA polymerase sigma-70 factor (ECF subfamily)